MASEIARPRILANFKRRSVKQPHRNSHWRDERPGMSRAHLEAVRQCPCCVCDKMQVIEAHHLKQGTGERGMAVRSTDRWTVPLCRGHHDDVERIGAKNEREWFRQFGLDPHTLARDLWQSTGDVNRMRRIVAAHRGDGSWTSAGVTRKKSSKRSSTSTKVTAGLPKPGQSSA